jgi:hypothetical protein
MHGQFAGLLVAETPLYELHGLISDAKQVIKKHGEWNIPNDIKPLSFSSERTHHNKLCGWS